MNAYGIKKSNQFEVLDSLGGRFSVWSSISLPAFINSNFDSYLELLEGARLADEHAKDASWESNIPVMMALLGVWNTNSLNINNHGIFIIFSVTFVNEIYFSTFDGEQWEIYKFRI